MIQTKAICNVCDRPAIWREDGLAFCEYHSPIEHENGPTPKGKPFDLPDIDSDVEFLANLATKLDGHPQTVPLAVRLRQIASRIQGALDAKSERLIYLRRHTEEAYPIDEKAVGVVLDTAVANVNYVGKLQEISQKTRRLNPDYHFFKDGPDHDPDYRCDVTFSTPEGRLKVSAEAPGKKEAKQAAALKAIVFLQKYL